MKKFSLILVLIISSSISAADRVPFTDSAGIVFTFKKSSVPSAVLESINNSQRLSNIFSSSLPETGFFNLPVKREEFSAFVKFNENITQGMSPLDSFNQAFAGFNGMAILQALEFNDPIVSVIQQQLNQDKSKALEALSQRDVSVDEALGKKQKVPAKITLVFSDKTTVNVPTNIAEQLIAVEGSLIANMAADLDSTELEVVIPRQFSSKDKNMINHVFRLTTDPGLLLSEVSKLQSTDYYNKIIKLSDYFGFDALSKNVQKVLNLPRYVVNTSRAVRQRNDQTFLPLDSEQLEPLEKSLLEFSNNLASSEKIEYVEAHPEFAKNDFNKDSIKIAQQIKAFARVIAYLFEVLKQDARARYLLYSLLAVSRDPIIVSAAYLLELQKDATIHPSMRKYFNERIFPSINNRDEYKQAMFMLLMETLDLGDVVALLDETPVNFFAIDYQGALMPTIQERIRYLGYK